MTEMNDFDERGETEEGMRRRIIATTQAKIPPRYQEATVAEQDVTDWCDELVAAARAYIAPEPFNSPLRCNVTGVQSLLVTGPFGTGKTWQSYGVLRRIAAAGARVKWRAISAPDLFASMRPRPGHDSEGDFELLTGVPLLFLDDLGAAKGSDWTEEVLFRLVDYRSAWLLPTIYTSNLPFRSRHAVATLQTELSERVWSRLCECKVAAIKGDDRRDPRTPRTPD